VSNATAVAPTDLYRESAAAHGLTGGLNAVGDVEAARFHEEGYLVVEDAFDPSEVAQALDGLTYLMDGGDGEFRGVQYEPSMRDAVADLPVEERRTFVRKVFSFVDHDPRLKAMSGHVPLHRALERIIGAPPVLFQDMALSKPPRMGSEKPWHQDCAYFEFHPDTAVVGVWIALDEATYENGCMHVIPRSHRDGPVVHFQRRDWQICDTDVAASSNAVVPLRPGGCLFFHGLVHHGTPPNRTDSPRRALQFHYRPEDIVTVTREERLAVFGDEGKDVTC
jgi:phytanoyl-CoA hydroxylase